MKDISNSNFGLLIAYALPGFVVIWGLSGLWPVAPICVGDPEACSSIPSLVGFFNTAVGAITAGMVVSAIRFVVIDTSHHLTGLKRPKLDGQVLQENLSAVNTVVDQHYRYYQFHSNLLVAGVIAYGVHLYKGMPLTGLPEAMLVILAIIFWLTSRDNLRKYYTNLATFTINDKGMTMSNGMSKNKQGQTTKPNPRQTEKPESRQPAKSSEAKAKPSKA